MIKNNVYYEWYASVSVPNPELVGYWIDLGADSKGRIIKTYNHDLKRWVVLFDVSKDDYVPPFIGSNGNWWVDNRDTGISATSSSPYIGDNGHWFVYDPINKVWSDTGIEARGHSAYEVAVENGYQGSENDWLDSLSAASEEAAVVALEAADKANEAADKANEASEQVSEIVEDAVIATEKANEYTSNPPKIIDGNWWLYDIEQKKYVDSGIQAIGDAFTYKKEYPSVEAMEADLGTADVKIGEYVIINTGNVEDPDDAKVYLKTSNGWKFIVDLSGMQGIQGWSAYEVAVNNGFVGTEAEWIQSLKQPSLDAAAEALAAKAAVEATDAAVKEAEAARVQAEDARVSAENARIEAENIRASNESTRVSNEATRQQQEADRQSNTATAISNANAATSAAQEATTDAIEATTNATTQANRAKEYADNPPEVHDDGYWYTWDEGTDQYVNTGWQASGLRLLGEFDSLEELQATVTNPEYGDGYMINGDLYLWDGEQWNNIARIQGPEVELTKAKIEAALVGEVTTHTHDTRYYTKEQVDNTVNSINTNLTDNYYNKSQVDSKLTSVYKFKGSVATEADLPIEGNIIGDVWNIESNDKNVAWTGTDWDALGGTAELASLTANGLMSKEDYAKLQGIETGAQANKIESITKRVLLNVVDKNVTIPEDIKISNTEPTEEEIMWLDPSEDYDLNTYTKDEANTNFVSKIGDNMTGDLLINGGKVWHAGNDGPGSGLDADTLDGKHYSDISSDYVTLNTSQVISAVKTFTQPPVLSNTHVRIKNNSEGISATGLIWFNDSQINIGAIGASTTDGSNFYTFMGWGENFKDKANNFAVSSTDITYKNNKVWHAGNDGEGSGLDADKLDGRESGLKNNQIAIYVDFPTPATLISNGFLTDTYVSIENPDEEYFKALCKWAIYNYSSAGNRVILQGTVNPNYWGWCVISLYCAEGSSEDTQLPRYCSGQYNRLLGNTFKFGTHNYEWYYRELINKDELEESLSYWYENGENSSSSICNTGGNRNIIESLRSKFKRCVAKPYGDNEVVISYLNENDSTKFPNGSTIAGNAASQTYVMVHFPKYYHKTVEVSSGRWRTYISEVQIDNDYIEEPEMLVGVFEAHKPSDVNWLTSLSGVTSTASQTISTFYTQAQANGTDWGLIDYRAHATIARMFCAYYGTTNISAPNADIPCSGGTKRYDYGSTGGTLSLGNADGKAEVNGDAGYYSTSFLGLEDCYYSKWEFVQGLNIIGENYITYDGGCFPGKDVAALEEAGATNIRVIGAKPYSSEAENTYYNGWIRRVAQGRYGDVMPTEIGGSESTYYTDYTWQYKQAETGERIFLRSGGSDNGSHCGVFVALCYTGSSVSNVAYGSRLGFYGKINVVDSDTFKSIAGI